MRPFSVSSNHLICPSMLFVRFSNSSCKSNVQQSTQCLVVKVSCICFENRNLKNKLDDRKDYVLRLQCYFCDLTLLFIENDFLNNFIQSFHKLGLLFYVLGRPCSKSDYEIWSPHNRYTRSLCVLGQTLKYERRKRKSVCFNGLNYDRPVNTTKCKCSFHDYEWYVLWHFQGRTNGRVYGDVTPPPPNNWKCSRWKYYYSLQKKDFLLLNRLLQMIWIKYKLRVKRLKFWHKSRVTLEQDS